MLRRKAVPAMEHRALVAAAVAALLGLSGCFDMCPPSFSGATWHEPGIYATFQGMTGTDRPANPGLPFEGPSNGIGHLSLVSRNLGRGASVPNTVQLDASAEMMFQDTPSMRGSAAALGLAGPTVSVSADENTPRALVRAAFVDFLRNVTTASDATIDGWVSQGLNQTTQSGEAWYWNATESVRLLVFRASVSGPFRLEPLYEDVGAREAAARGFPGFAWHTGGDWRFRFDFNTRTIQLPDGIRATADESDTVDVWISGDTPTPQFASARLNASFAKAGIAFAGPRLEDFSGSVC